MDAVEFVKERNRMCSTYTPKRCEGCPADNYGKEGTACIMVDKIDAERLVPIVEKWAAAHPRKTRQDVFLEQYPEAEMDEGVLFVCPAVISPLYRKGTGGCIHIGTNCADCRRKFWWHEVE